MPEPIVDRADGTDPEHEALLADSVGLALLVVLETLTPAERLAFVLHDMFARARSTRSRRSSTARPRRRASSRAAPAGACAASAPSPTPTWRRQREVVDAFLAAARDGDFDALVAVLDPDVVVRADVGAAARLRVVRGAEAVAGQALTFTRSSASTSAPRSSTAPPARSRPRRRPFSVGGFTVRDGRIVEIDFLADPERLRTLDLTILDS